MKEYEIIRWVKEVYWIEANSRKEAIENCDDPHTCTITKLTCKLIVKGDDIA